MCVKLGAKCRGGKGAGAAGQRTSNINVFRHLLAALRHFSSTTEDKMSCGRSFVNTFLRITLQRSTLFCAPGLVKFVSAVAIQGCTKRWAQVV